MSQTPHAALAAQLQQHAEVRPGPRAPIPTATTARPYPERLVEALREITASRAIARNPAQDNPVRYRMLMATLVDYAHEYRDEFLARQFLYEAAVQDGEPIEIAESWLRYRNAHRSIVAILQAIRAEDELKRLQPPPERPGGAVGPGLALDEILAST